MDFDEEQYTRDVLEPARLADSQPPADLTVRYGLSMPLSAPRIAATLPRVLGCWRRARRELKYRRLVARLEADHARLARAFDRAAAGDLGPLRAAIEQAESGNRDRTERLRSEIVDLAVPVGRITPELVAELTAGHGVPSGAVARLLAGSGVDVVVPDPLPRQPPVTGYPRYRIALRTLGCRHTADFLLDGRDDALAQGAVTLWHGVAVAGRPDRQVTPETVAAVDRAWAARPHDGSRTLASTVLVALKALADSRGADGIAELARYEIAEELRVRHRQGASARALVDFASSTLGLAGDDARRMAFAVRSEPRGDSDRDPTPAATPATPAVQPTPSPDPATATSPAPAGPDPATPPGHDAPAVGSAATRRGPISKTPPRTGRSAPATGRESLPATIPAALPTPGHPAADRLGDEVVVRWQWPPELTEVRLRWRARHGGDPRWREKTISRGGYRSQGGAWLPFDDGSDSGCRNRPLEIQLIPVTPAHPVRAPVTVQVPGRVQAWYEVARTGPPWRRRLTVAVRTGQPAQLRTLLVVLRRGSVMPLHATDGEVLRQLDDVRLSPDSPLRLRLPAPRGPYWLRCFASADESTDEVVELRDPPVVQLRGR
ncbi:MAG TPA: hypothetical protein VFZ32_03140 [Micromonosporaceae bacterium]